jgi:hypothetical protein
MLLTKHEGVTFKDQTVYISGQAFVRCHFIGCTLVLRETVRYLEGCTFERCNWHVDWVLMWGSPESLQKVTAPENAPTLVPSGSSNAPTERVPETANAE